MAIADSFWLAEFVSILLGENEVTKNIRYKRTGWVEGGSLPLVGGKEGRKEGSKEGRKKGRKEGR